MKKNYVKIVTLTSLFVGVNFAYAQKSDSTKVKDIDEVTITIGSRNKNRVATDTPVPVDVINISEQTPLSAQTDLNQILNFTAPSFTSNPTAIADGTDHIDPAQLRGLGPDQVLVLLNGKRRHTSALVNINGSPGRGSVGTDLNAIPAFAIDRLEVLRDGASAQYGSDAIAGVINVAMKKATGQLNAAITAGGFNSKGSNDFDGGWDGEKYQLDLNYGAKIGGNGFVNVTGSLMTRNYTSRANPYSGTIYNAYNAIEGRAMEDGVNITSMFSNINNTSNADQILSYIKQYAPDVSYFTADQQSAIASATSISAMQAALSSIGDVSDSELAYRGLQRSDFNMRVGQSKLFSGQLYVNSEFDITPNIRGYAFGGYSFRQGNAAGYYRRPNQSRTSTSLYIDGFLPEIHSDVEDISFAAGFKGKLGTVNYDISNTFGQNSFTYHIENTANASMLYPSQTEFDAGRLAFAQNTINADFDKSVDWLEGLNLAFGGEVRFENYKIEAGEEASWAQYNYDGSVHTSDTQVLPTDFFGNARPGGAQVFPGFKPINALSKGRTSFALYSDNELDVTEKWLVSAALRFENYSDFGSTFNYKLATRYKITDDINFRAAHSTGFRAPSLHQIYFNTTSTLFTNGEAYETGTFSNDSNIAHNLGIPQLKQERSTSYSAGFTGKIPSANLSITVDGYYIKIKDRIVLTGTFTPVDKPQNELTDSERELNNYFTEAQVSKAIFFANAIDTETKGIEAVISQRAKFGNVKMNTDLALATNKTKRVGNIHASDVLESTGQINTYYSESNRVYLEEAVPRFKLSLNNGFEINKFSFLLRNVYFGKVTDPDAADANGDGVVDTTLINGQDVKTEHPVWGGRLITDLSVEYQFTKNVKLAVGSNNLFDVYPAKNLPSINNSNQYVYSRNVSQFGTNGRYLFAKLNLSF